jgi:hypothetical protein
MRGPHAPRCAAQCLAHASPSSRRRREGNGAQGRRRVCERLVGGFGNDVLGFGPVAAGLWRSEVIFLDGSTLSSRDLLCEYSTLSFTEWNFILPSSILSSSTSFNRPINKDRTTVPFNSRNLVNCITRVLAHHKKRWKSRYSIYLILKDHES